MCAYLGETPTLNNINPLKQRIPLPNWRITFDGIGKIKSLENILKNYPLLMHIGLIFHWEIILLI